MIWVLFPTETLSFLRLTLTALRVSVTSSHSLIIYLFYFIEYSLTGLHNSINANLGALQSSGRKTEQKVSLNL